MQRLEVREGRERIGDAPEIALADGDEIEDVPVLGHLLEQRLRERERFGELVLLRSPRARRTSLSIRDTGGLGSAAAMKSSAARATGLCHPGGTKSLGNLFPRERVAEPQAEGSRPGDGRRLVPLPGIRVQRRLFVGEVLAVELHRPGILRDARRRIEQLERRQLVGDGVALQVEGQPVGRRERAVLVSCRSPARRHRSR